MQGVISPSVQQRRAVNQSPSPQAKAQVKTIGGMDSGTCGNCHKTFCAEKKGR